MNLLAKLTAERVMGFRWSPSYGGWLGGVVDQGKSWAPHLKTRHAFQVVEKIMELKRIQNFTLEYGWEAKFEEPAKQDDGPEWHESKFYKAESNSMEEAICMAALEVVGVSVIRTRKCKRCGMDAEQSKGMDDCRGCGDSLFSVMEHNEHVV